MKDESSKSIYLFFYFIYLLGDTKSIERTRPILILCDSKKLS